MLVHAKDLLPLVKWLRDPFAASVAPCSMLSRTLRAGCAGADGILDNICARRSADRQVGTKEWSLAVEQRNEV
jgi:hypothetical protein